MKQIGNLACVGSVLIGVLCISCSSAPSSPAAAARPMLAYHLPAPVANGQAAPMGAVGPTQRLKLAIHLPLRNPADLTRLLHDLYDPAKASFHRYLSVAEFTERFGPAQMDYDAVVAWARTNGFTDLHPTQSTLRRDGGLGGIGEPRLSRQDQQLSA